MTNLSIRDEVSLLFLGTQLCTESKPGYDGALQVAPLFCSLPYRHGCLERLDGLKACLSQHFPELIAFGDARAAKAYQSTRHSITKPSYTLRLTEYGAKRKSQIENMLEIAEREPASGGLVFSVFEPSDLEVRRRPGFVPCLVAGSFLLHENEFQMNVFFRSQSIVEFGLQDIMFLRRLQAEVVGQLNNRRGTASRIEPGSLNVQFGRLIIQRRLMRNRRGFVHRDKILAPWLKVVGDFAQRLPNQ